VTRPPERSGTGAQDGSAGVERQTSELEALPVEVPAMPALTSEAAIEETPETAASSASPAPAPAVPAPKKAPEDK
jgi:hypothetical protein